jgi:hypothetical protein
MCRSHSLTFRESTIWTLQIFLCVMLLLSNKINFDISTKKKVCRLYIYIYIIFIFWNVKRIEIVCYEEKELENSSSSNIFGCISLRAYSKEWWRAKRSISLSLLRFWNYYKRTHKSTKSEMDVMSNQEKGKSMKEKSYKFFSSFFIFFLYYFSWERTNQRNDCKVNNSDRCMCLIATLNLLTVRKSIRKCFSFVSSSHSLACLHCLWISLFVHCRIKKQCCFENN